MTTEYLPLAEYSSKYKVSISTLRRRIKAEDIRFVFEDGKYLIQDDPMSTHQRVNRPSPRISEATSKGVPSRGTSLKGVPFEGTPGLMSAHNDSFRSLSEGGTLSEAAPMFGRQNSGQHAEPKSFRFAEKATDQTAAKKQEEPVLAVANRLLTELKKAYSQILHEKEEQILHLNEELLDLKTLVRVLESENDRLTRLQK